ncbi:hypothetical protein DSM03_101962 [Leeuwenhoekiella aestuarii]|uniref:HTH luxR-type domain-containing protein n=1 Tax=Leeuwenhoekiella aestuarii TaxID=2249426 RepID=A0A4Q0NZ95_9FLAO|nr:hypothetical protein [Leeuwenhoekiella aestuarii]RXG18280.1 hypothetical protein DSM04_101473 [Leeuwenhoekiella aestuarii]RXG19585.1 hypothetical protein DSM03_101962 [Leeuwenhoekiella aestuarii]
MFSKYLNRFILVVLLLSGTSNYAQNFFPPVTNYSSNTYNAASQNWGLSTDADGILYAANNEGLLRFDGQRWEVFTLPNQTIIRSVFCLGDRIYTGSYEEFGYWTKTRVGGLQYTSLTHLIDTTFQNEEFWQIYSVGNTVYFRSFGKLYRYENNKISAFQPDFVITAMTFFKNQLFLGANDGRIYRFQAETFKAVTFNTNNSSAIIELTSFKGKLLAGTRINGIFSFKDEQLIPWGNPNLSEFLNTNELNKIEPFNESLLIIGTIKGGILYYNPKTQTFKNQFRQNGLQNNTVLSLHKSNTKVWLGLDNGIDEIIPDAPIQYFLDNTGQLGAVYDIAYFNDAFYVGSNTGVHKITDSGLSFIPGSQGQVWSFSTINNQLYINHNLGLFELKNDQLSLISGASGSFSLTQIPQSQEYINSTYNGLKRYKMQAENLENLPLYEAGGAPVEHIIFEDKTHFWAAHPYKGFYAADLDLAELKISNQQFYTTHESLDAYKTTIHQIEGQTAFYNAGNWYRYNRISKDLELFKDLKSYNSYALLSNQENSYWFKNRNGNGLVYTDFTQDSIFIYEPVLESRSIKNYERIIKRNDSIYLITLNEGFGRLNLTQLKQAGTREQMQEPLLSLVSTSKSTLDINASIFKIDYNESATIDFEVAAPSLHKPEFYYTLSNGNKGYSKGTLSFQNLQSGSYKLNIWPLVNGKQGEKPLTIDFVISRPWYLSNMMIVIYVLLLFGIIFLIAVINKNKLNKHRRELEERLVKEQERKTQIAERNKLLQEINTKRKELANTTYLAAKRNSSLIDIKNELEDVKEKGSNPKKVSNIQSKINHIIDAKDNWKVFETTFKEINDDFFHQLLEDHSDLSSKDLKLCAYLKMNLSTKEIAPLMAISVRGVEIHRYRLRKKLGLKSGKNLSKYLIKNY